MTKETVTVNPRYKDRLFRSIFGREENRAFLLSLYNALNHTEYKDPNELQIVTLDDVIYMGMKNDVSFLVQGTIHLYEHQSTDNPNMPVRELLYYARQLEAHSKANRLNLFGSKQVKIPTPRCIVFYNGKKDLAEDCYDLHLSDHFCVPDPTHGYQWTSTVFNINAGHNTELMEQCPSLKEYAAYVAKVREYEKSMELTEAVYRAVDEAVAWPCLGEFFVRHKSEVIDVLLTEFDRELYEKDLREEGLEAGLEKGRKEAILANIRTIMQTLNLTEEQAMQVLKIPEAEQPEYAMLLNQ